MTILEIMIVTIIIAMIAAGVAVAVWPQYKKAQVNAAKSDVAAVRAAVQLFVAENPGKCPEAKQLQEESYLDKSKRAEDPWGNEFVIKCSDGDVQVYSMGPDGQDNTEDDIGRSAED
jgi:general secretion pathway protein G